MCFIVGETEVAVWSRPGAEEQTRYATNITSTVLEYFEEFFQIPYPLPKQDMIAIPDFGAGAMENWGLITYRYLFFNLRIREIHKRNIWYAKVFFVSIKTEIFFSTRIYINFLRRENKNTIYSFVIVFLLHKLISSGCKLSL